MVKRVLAWLLSLVFRPVFWMMKMRMPEHPAGAASGPLAPNAEYLAMFSEGDPEPTVVIVLRFAPGTQYNKQMSSVSTSSHEDDDGAREIVTLGYDALRIQLTLDPERRTLGIQGASVPLGEANVVLCAFEQDGALVPGSIRALHAPVPNVRTNAGAELELLAIPTVGAFVRGEAA